MSPIYPRLASPSHLPHLQHRANPLPTPWVCHTRSVAMQLGVTCLLAKLEAASTRVVASVEEAAAAGVSGSGSVGVVVGEGLQVLLPMAGLFDVAKEMARLNKQKQKVGGWRGERCLACFAGRGRRGRLSDVSTNWNGSPIHAGVLSSHAHPLCSHKELITCTRFPPASCFFAGGKGAGRHPRAPEQPSLRGKGQ